MAERFYIDPAELPSEGVIFGSTPAMQEVRARVASLLGSRSPLLIQGESGTGKELVARFIHCHSESSDGRFVKLNCTAVPAELLERELFGFKRGAFRGARSSKKGLVDLAESGTLFLAGIEEMDWSLQGKVCRLLQDGRYFRVGGFEERRIEIRVVCSTEVELADAIIAGRFRQDLFSLFSGACLRLPALRDRKEDLPRLWEFFAQRFATKFNRKAPQLTPAALRVLEGWNWPGNLHELENGVARAIILSDENALGAELRNKMAWKSTNDAPPSEDERVGDYRELELTEPETEVESQSGALKVFHANGQETWEISEEVQNSRQVRRSQRGRSAPRRCRTRWRHPPGR